MFDRLKTSLSVLLGLALGLLAALPMMWWGSRRGAQSLTNNVVKAAEAVNRRQNGMADQALRLQHALAQWGWTKEKAIFEALQLERSRLAGSASLPERIERLQRLEQVLLLGEKAWERAGGEAKVAAHFDYGRWGREWELDKRYLVREQKHLEDTVVEFNQLLHRWPASVALRYKSITEMFLGFFGDVGQNLKFLVRWGLDWAGYAARRSAALVSQVKPPEPPRWKGLGAKAAEPYLEPLPRPVFLADAPPPEGEYRELQYGIAPVNVADIEMGEEPAVLERRHAPAPFVAPVPMKQTTVTYR